MGIEGVKKGEQDSLLDAQPIVQIPKVWYWRNWTALMLLGICLNLQVVVCSVEDIARRSTQLSVSMLHFVGM